MSSKILFTITFVYGVIFLLSNTYLFRTKLKLFIPRIFRKLIEFKKDSLTNLGEIVLVILQMIILILKFIEIIIYVFSMFYQVYFWFFKIIKMEV